MTNGHERLVVNARVRDLRGDRTQILGFNITRVNGDTRYMPRTVRRANGKTTARLGGYSSDGTTLDVACKVTRKWRPAQNTIKVAFARYCLQEQGRVRVSLYIGAGNGTIGDPADWTKVVRVTQG